MSFANDTFTETSDTAITSHTPDSGGTWTQHPSFANGATIVASEDRVRGDSSTTTTICYHSATPASADYDIEGVVRRTTTDATPNPRVMGRINTTAATFIQLIMSHSDNTFAISEVSNGTVSEINSTAQTWAADTDYTIKLEIRGTGTNGAKGYLDGVQKVQLTPDVVTAAGKAGLGSRLYGRVDNWVATDAGGGAAALAGNGIATSSVIGASLFASSVAGNGIGTWSAVGSSLAAAAIAGDGVATSALVGASLFAGALAGNGVATAAWTGDSVGGNSGILAGTGVATASIVSAALFAAAAAGDGVGTWSAVGASIRAGTLQGTGVSTAQFYSTASAGLWIAQQAADGAWTGQQAAGGAWVRQGNA